MKCHFGQRFSISSCPLVGAGRRLPINCLSISYYKRILCFVIIESNFATLRKRTSLIMYWKWKCIINHHKFQMLCTKYLYPFFFLCTIINQWELNQQRVHHKIWLVNTNYYIFFGASFYSLSKLVYFLAILIYHSGYLSKYLPKIW